MALNWTLMKVDDAVCWRKCNEEWPGRMECSDEQRAAGTEFMHPATDKLIWATTAVGMPTITEKNYLDFFCRVQIYEALMGKMGWHTEDSALFWTEMDKAFGWEWHDGESWLSKVEVIHAHIGLGTNATRETRAQFVNRITKRFKEDYERIMKRKLEA
jgi:hypothetical protein